MKWQDKGITLVALVVTIIVLLVLAGITISLVFSEDGIIAKAQQAKSQTEIKNLEEQVKLAVLDLKAKNNGKEAILADIIQQLVDNKSITQDEAEQAISSGYITKNGQKISLYQQSWNQNYVQDQLILHLDAKNNKGIDEFDANAKVWKDLSNHNLDANLTNFEEDTDTIWQEKGLKFDGSNDRAVINGNFSKYKTGVPFSYSATYTTNDIFQWRGIISNISARVANGNGGFNIQYGNYNFAVYLSQGSGYIGREQTDFPLPNKTYQTTVSYDGQNLSLYINGKLKVKQVATIMAGEDNLVIGGFYTTSLLHDGTISNVMFYNKALSEEEVRNNYLYDKQRFKIEE